MSLQSSEEDFYKGKFCVYKLFILIVLGMCSVTQLHLTL